MAEKRFTVFFKNGTTQPVRAASGDQDEEPEGYVFFVDSTGEIVGLFAKDVVKSWHEDPDRT
jgi:hypothetical protein